MDAPTAAAQVPALHKPQVAIEVAASSDDHVPGLHAVHWKVNEAPKIDDHVPELQLKQDVEPAEAYNPALHDLH
jgi:hypothetical protein